MTKTNAMRLLEKAGVAFRTAEYPWDESDLSGVHAAQAIGMMSWTGTSMLCAYSTVMAVPPACPS